MTASADKTKTLRHKFLIRMVSNELRIRNGNMLMAKLRTAPFRKKSLQENREVEALKSGIAELSAEIQKIGQNAYNKTDADKPGENDKGDNNGEPS